MSKKFLISDANIIIDIIAGNLIEAMFSLNYEFGTPDILYAEELEDQHPEIQKAGLKLLELQPKSIETAMEYYENNTASKVSVNDCIALSLAQQEQCTLLTGDAKLRQLAIVEGVRVKGTLWLVRQLVVNAIITIDEAEQAYVKMQEDGSRLPSQEIQNQLKKLSKNK